jgi:predicted methyltransferase
MKRLAGAAATAVAMLTAGCATTPGGVAPPAPYVVQDPALRDVLASPYRPPASVARDEQRHPAQTLAFWGLRPGITVIEVQPGAEAWYPEILAPYAARTGGRYVVGHADLANPRLSDNARRTRAEFETRFSDRAKWGRVETVGFGPQSPPLGQPGSADLVINAGAAHGWLRVGMIDKAMADFYAVLKPGGVLGLEQPRAPEGQNDLKWMSETGYVSEAYVIEAALKAGFRLGARSEINANPRDRKDHPFGVWTLPPVRRTSPFGQPDDLKFDRAKYDAIGEPDRMTLKFVKP